MCYNLCAELLILIVEVHGILNTVFQQVFQIFKIIIMTSCVFASVPGIVSSMDECSFMHSPWLKKNYCMLLILIWNLNVLQSVPVRIISDKISRTKIWLSTVVLCVSLYILHNHAGSQVVFILKVFEISFTCSEISFTCSQMNGGSV